MNLEQTGKVAVSGLVTYPVVTILVLLSGGTVQSAHKGGGCSAHAHHRRHTRLWRCGGQQQLVSLISRAFRRLDPVRDINSIIVKFFMQDAIYDGDAMTSQSLPLILPFISPPPLFQLAASHQLHRQ